jgi:hypothetical protein
MTLPVIMWHCAPGTSSSRGMRFCSARSRVCSTRHRSPLCAALLLRLWARRLLGRGGAAGNEGQGAVQGSFAPALVGQLTADASARID